MKSYRYKLKAEKDTEFTGGKIVKIEDAVDYAMKFYKDDIHLYESCFMILLDTGNNIIGWAKISQGGISETAVDARLVCKYAIETLCTSVILVHNHPSGDKSPSRKDIEMTKKIYHALWYCEIKLADHIILTEKDWYSFEQSRGIMF